MRFSARTNWNTEESELARAYRLRHEAGLPIADLTASNPTRCGFTYPDSLLSSLADPRALDYDPQPRGLLAGREADWLSRFDLYVWSYQLRLAKPDPAIFHYTLDRLGARPEEALFIDDRAENVNAAIALGIQSLVFTTVDRLRADLIAAGFDNRLPLPAGA